MTRRPNGPPWGVTVDADYEIRSVTEAPSAPATPVPSGGGLWRPGGKNPFTLYRQRGPEPDRRPWPDGDKPLGFLGDPRDVDLACAAVNTYLAIGSTSFAVPYSTWTRLPGTSWEVYQGGSGVAVIGSVPIAVMIRRA